MTTFYLRDAAPTNDPGETELSTALPVGTGSDLGFGVKSLSTTKGTTQTSIGANGLSQTAHQDNFFTSFSSVALAAQTIDANTWTLAVATSQANAQANSFTVCSVYVFREPSTVVGFIYDSDTALGVEWGNTEDGQVLTFSGASVTAQENDYLVLEFWRHATQAMVGPYVQTLYYDGTTDVTDTTTTDAASYLSTPQTLSFAGAAPRKIRLPLMGVGH